MPRRYKEKRAGVTDSGCRNELWISKVNSSGWHFKIFGGFVFFVPIRWQQAVRDCTINKSWMVCRSEPLCRSKKRICL